MKAIIKKNISFVTIVKPAYLKVNSFDISELRNVSDKLNNSRKDMWWHFSLFVWWRWTIRTLQRQFSKRSHHWMYWKSSSWNYWCYHHGNPLWWYSWMQGWKWWKLWGRQDDLNYCCCSSFPDNNLYLPLLGLHKVANLEKFHVSGFWRWEHYLNVKAFWL